MRVSEGNPDDKSAELRTPSDLYSFAGAGTDEDLAAWISGSTELDALIEHDDTNAEVLVVRFLNRGVTIEFPLALAEFWETIEELHDAVAQELEWDDECD
jgi:hypothetical protein